MRYQALALSLRGREQSRYSVDCSSLIYKIMYDHFDLAPEHESEVMISGFVWFFNSLGRT